MTDSISLELVTNQIRESLQRSGELGILLLNDIDYIVAGGIEQEESSNRTDDHITRRPAQPVEVLEVYIHALKTYLVDLPLIANRVHIQFQSEFHIEQLLLSLQSDLSPLAQSGEALNFSSISEFYHENNTVLLAQFRAIEELLNQLNSQGDR